MWGLHPPDSRTVSTGAWDNEGDFVKWHLWLTIHTVEGGPRAPPTMGVTRRVGDSMASR